MYLKRLELQGFKSFADKTVLEFMPGITTVIGPNGSGKSNISDSIRWVLGEQSMKSLRGSKSEDIIFAGTQNRKSLGFAEASIVIDNTDGKLPIEYSEVTVTRRIYRNGESGYYINKTPCRLKDVLELFMDTGIGKDGYSIIGQGKIDEILTTKPYDRRVIFEEAAGVLKYKRRKEEAIRKLERTNTNINRVNDIILELENNLKPLEAQSKEAKEYLECKDKLTNYDIALMIYDVDNYSRELNNSKEEVNTLTDRISEIMKNNANYDINILSYKDKLNRIENTLTENNQLILNYTKLLEQTGTDLKLLRERKKYQDNNSDSERIIRLQEEIMTKKEELSKIKSDKEINLSRMNILIEEVNNIQDKYRDIKNKINSYNNQVNENNREITNLEYQVNYLEDMINNGGNMPKAVKSLIHNPLFSGVYGTIGTLINTKNEYSLAVSTSMGGASNYLVVSDRNLASRMVEYLKNNQLGRATFFPLDVIRPRYIDSDTINRLSLCEGYINTLDRVIEYDDKYEGVILNQFGNVILVDNINNANKISKIINNKYKIVTLDGQVVNVGGSITGGDKIKTNDPIKQKYELTEYINKLDNLKKKNNNLLEEITRLDKENKEYEENIHNKNIDRLNYQDKIDNKNYQYDKLEKELYDLEKELSDIEVINGNNTENEENNLINKYYQIKEKIDSLNKDITLIKLERDKINKELKEIEDTSRTSNQNISKLEKNLHDYELRVGKLEVYIDNILNSLNEDYSITYNEAKEKYILTEDAEEVRKEVVILKNKMKDFGMVNLGAPLEYERVSTRYNFLMNQKEDLNKAESTLLEIIQDMDTIMKERFVNTFNEIRKEFKEVFRELFKGGNADIYMTNPDNVLETGIELEATPPGKNLKNIQSLSGGEKTFTAISLLFAILNVRPVPFCLFDEVEAALDDANVDAFGEYLNKYRDKTQFIIITHKKKTMEFIDTLYGITMQESGVSKKVSVKLSDMNINKERD